MSSNPEEPLPFPVMQRSVATKASPHFSAVNVLIIGLASEDCYVVLRTPHNDKEYVMQRSLEKGDEGISAL